MPSCAACTGETSAPPSPEYQPRSSPSSPSSATPPPAAGQGKPRRGNDGSRYLAVMLIVGFPLDDPSGPYGVTLVTDPAELGQAVTELTSGRPTAYVILRVSENSYDNSNRGLSLRQLIERQGLISRPPTTGEREALETGLDTMGILRASYGRAKP